MALQLDIGDAVIPRHEPDHDVMTVYDLQDGYRVALCNWVVGSGRMLKATYLVVDLTRVQRKQARSN